MFVIFDTRKDGSKKLSEHFKVSEFACRDGNPIVSIGTDLVTALEDVRSHFGGKPVVITSAFRTYSYNQKVGGAEYSQHLYGRAADFYINGIKPADIYNYLCSKYPDRYGIGLYSSFVHLDTRAVHSVWKN